VTTAYETKKDWRDEFVYQHFPNTGYWPTLEAQYRELGLGYISPPSNIAAIHSLRVRWDIAHWTIAVTGSGFPHPPTRDDILIDGFDGKYGESGWRLEAGQRVHARIYSSDGRLLACRSAIALL